MSLAVFKPTKATDFVWEEEAREWDLAKACVQPAARQKGAASDQTS